MLPGPHAVVGGLGDDDAGGVAPVGSEVGELDSSVRLPPLTANAPTAPALLSST